MKVIAIEEHFATAEVIAAWKGLDPAVQDIAVRMSTGNDKERRLLDLAEVRIAAMDEAGVDVQVLSLTTPGVQSLVSDIAVALARAANDLIAETVRHHPDRFQGFATLPTGAPDEAARELKRAVHELGLNGAMLFGRTGGRNLDHPEFTPILEAAAELHAPLYLHPQSPQLPVREIYYQGLGSDVEAVFSTGGIGWHYETGVQTLRLILSGVFDRLPDLQIILGHWGEVVLFYLDRINILTASSRLPRPISEYFRTNVFVTPGGTLSQRYLEWAIEVLGADRILFSTDYPFEIVEYGGGRRFLETANLSDTVREKIASGNWDRICADIRR